MINPHLLDEVGRPWHVMRQAHLQLPLTIVKFVRVFFGDFPRGPAGALALGLHLVFATFNVIESQVTDIGDIHHLDDFVALVLNEAPEHIGEQETAKIANMRRAVDRRTTVIHRHLAIDDWA